MQSKLPKGLLLGFVLPRRSALERLPVYLSWYVQLPVGILIYVTPQAFSVPLVFVRFAYFVTALLLLAEIYRRRAGTQATAPI